MRPACRRLQRSDQSARSSGGGCPLPVSFWAEGIPEGRVDIPTVLAGFSRAGGFPSGPNGKKKPACHTRDARDTGLIPGLGRSAGGGNGSPLQYPGLENPMGRGTWQATVHRVVKSQTRLNTHTHTNTHAHTHRQRDYEGIEMGPPCFCRSPGTPRPGQTRVRGCMGRNESFCL